MAKVEISSGKYTDTRTAAMLREAQKISKVVFQYAQGSYTGHVSASGSTHDKGGVVDIRTIPMASRAQKIAVIKALRQVGFAAWLRPYIKGLWGEHIHAVAVQPKGKYDTGVLSNGARNQVIAYYNRRDGLAGNRVDPHDSLSVPKRTWEEYKRLRDTPVVSFAKMTKDAKMTRLVQKALKHYIPDIVVDGIWGPQTSAAWKTVRARLGLERLALLRHLAPYGRFRAVA